MNLNPMRWFRAAKQLPGQVDPTVRASAPEGPFTSMFDRWIAREVNPWLYEALREAVAPIDGAIVMMTTLDGIIRVEGEDQALIDEISAWMQAVQVNDMENGFQAFYASQGNEMYEQGFTIGEVVLARARNDVERLRVADSKGVVFRRADSGALETWYAPPGRRVGRFDGTDQLERVLRNSFPGAMLTPQGLEQFGYRQIDRRALVYGAFNPEADGPYGVSIMRSTEFDARVLLVMKNALHQVWSRFGDPAFSVTLKSAKRAMPEHEVANRRKALATNLANVLDIKKSGNSADFVNVIGKDDILEIEVIGHDGQVLELEQPARHVLEQIVSKTGLPSWMLGFHWSTAERLAERQGEIVLQQSKTRFERRKPGLTRVVATMLRARGRTWREGDWRLVQELPNIQDLVAQAQARFLNRQAEMMSPTDDEGTREPRAGARTLARVTASGHVILPTDDDYGQVPAGDKHAAHAHKVEQYVEDARNLMRLERMAERDLLGKWRALYGDLIEALGLEGARAPAVIPRSKAEPIFIFDPALTVGALGDLEDEFVRGAGADGELARSSYRAWLRGMVNAAAEASIAAVEESIRAGVQTQIAEHSLGLVRAAATRALRSDIIGALKDGVYDGQNPRAVARALRARFEAHEVDWVRLARSEIAAAHGRGKIDTYAANAIESYDWNEAGSACPICVGLAARGPYPVGNGPMPMTDSHPNCRCTVTARIA